MRQPGKELTPRGQRTRERIVDAAITVFAARGYDATTITAVAEECGLTPPAAYRYFSDKDELYLVALDAAEEAFQVDIAARVEDIPFPFLRGAFNRAVLEALPDHPLVRRVWHDARPRDMAWLSSSMQAHARRRRFADELARGQRLGIVRRELDPVALATSADHLGVALRPLLAADDPRPETWSYLEYVIVAAVFALPADYGEPGGRERFFAHVEQILLGAAHD